MSSDLVPGAAMDTPQSPLLKLQAELEHAHKESQDIAATVGAPLLKLQAELKEARAEIEVQRKEKEMWQRKYNALAEEHQMRTNLSQHSGDLHSQEVDLLRMLATEPWAGLLPRRVILPSCGTSD